MASICTSKPYVHINQMYDHKQICYCVQCPRAKGKWVSGTSGAPFYVLMSLWKVTSKYNDGILEWNTEWQINRIYTLYKGGMRWVWGRVGSGGINHKSTNGTAGSGFHHKYCVSIADNIDMRWKASYLTKCFGRTCLYIFFQWFLFDINCIS